jgi:multiple sugar transport system substrate-binding protein
LALFYNKKIFDNAGIAEPPRTWEDFEKVASKLTTFNRNGQMTKAGGAIGSSSRNINEATSLLSLIMLQKDVQMLSPNLDSANFSRGNGTNALDFYTHFTNPRSNSYIWDATFHYSLDAFAEESVAMIFNYAFQIPRIKDKNPFINMAVAPMPQFKDAPVAVNYANYFGLGVSKNSPNKDLAWMFILNSTTDQAVNADYLNATARPPALRSTIALAINDPTVGIFSRQALTSASWPQVDASAIDSIFSDMIESVSFGQANSITAIKRAEEQVTAIMNRNNE